ncbi:MULTISPECIES: AAA family ATPase [unclassified Caballeronia]|uniref:AAA family ATPase n=1 Tax=unclassified Caballeronia TaxID=2646786 RepID=UPI002854C221|nr:MULTISPECIES: AAA family ATPase [unclassified Caballeronia]MDR5753012.1 AAA family ATPase [Caballeronia sp. LZ024]MDR5845090.1 AAA family ATPase [Caballeronia sp. LZ031]
MEEFGFYDRSSHVRRVKQFIDRDNAGDGKLDALGVSGKGGAGKSTLLPHVRLDLAKMEGVVCVHIDFDRADFDAQTTAVLDRELVVQIGRSLPPLAELCRLSAEWMQRTSAETARDRLRSLRGAKGGESAMLASHPSETDRASSRSSLLRVLEIAHERMSHLVIITDTFERVESGGETAVKSLIGWIRNVQGVLSQTKCSWIIASRSKSVYLETLDSDMRCRHLGVNDLSRRGARSLLRRLGCGDEVAVGLSDALPHRTPLIVHLAAEAFANRPPKEQADFIGSLKSGRIPAELVAGYLYDRILRHVSDPLARLYAHPSLVLPELTSHLIHHVLIPVIEPDYHPDTDARYDHANDIFEALQCVHWLVESPRAGIIRLRPDLRELMLQLIESDSTASELAARNRDRAGKYHESQGGDWDQAMALYHRVTAAVKNIDVATVAEQVLRVGGFLLPFANDLPNVVRGLLSRGADSIATEDAIGSLSPESWRDLLEGVGGKSGRGQQTMDKSDPLVALTWYRNRPTRNEGVPPAFALQAACDSARWNELPVSASGICDEIRDDLFGPRPDDESDQPGRRRWRPALLRLQYLTRLRLFQRRVPLEPALPALFESTTARCKPYGAGLLIADTIAMAEAFENRAFLSPDFRMVGRPTDQMVRVAAMHMWLFNDPILIPLPIAGLIRFQSRTTLDGRFPDANSELLSAQGREMEFDHLNGRPWANFQAWFHQLQKMSPLPAEDGERFLGREVDPLDVVGLWPEFHRPLRQVLSEAFASYDDLRELGFAIQPLFSLQPSEFSRDNFAKIVSSDPHTWLFALCQHADRAKVLSDMADVACRLKPKHQRLEMVSSCLRMWQARVREIAGRAVD